MKKKVVITGLVFVIATVIIGVIESSVLMITRGASFGSTWGEGGWLQHLFAYSTVVPVIYLRSGTSPIFLLKIPVIASVLVLLGVSIWKRKLWLSLMAYGLGSLYWLFVVFLVTGVPLD